MLKKVIKRFELFLKRRKIANKVNISLNGLRLGRKATVSLLRGSQKGDITINDNVILYGSLISEYRGAIELGKFSQLGSNSVIRAVDQVVIGDFTAISNNVIICDNNTHPVHPADRIILRQTPHASYERSWINSDHAPIIIGKNCWIGENARICKGVTIGDGCIVAANAVVTKSAPANCILAGNPARIVKTDIEKDTKRYFDDKDYPSFHRI